MTRFLLFLVLSIVVTHIFWKIVASFSQGRHGRASASPGDSSERAVPMVRDPVCGTFVLPERAVPLVDGRSRVFFCSDACRDTYRARSATRSGRPEHVAGRTA